MEKRLQDQVAIVTGSTSGIGRATAELFASEGAKVVVTGRRAELGEQVVAGIRDAGGEARYYQADVSQTEQIRALIGFAVEAYGRLDILVNNAFSWPSGVRNASVVDMEESDWDYVQDVSLKAVFLACKYAIPIMIAHGGGSIVNTSSVHGVLAARQSAPYEAAKAGLINLTRQIAVDFGHQGVRCNVICPGAVIVERSEEVHRQHPERRRRSSIIYPLGRVGYPIDCAKSALFLASDDASFITGHALMVDGGLTAQLQDSLAGLVAETLREHGGQW
jgi:NAD(P)-dependent dehydrogenase (short-subunit alcohol dehydrogenase family)